MLLDWMTRDLNLDRQTILFPRTWAQDLGPTQPPILWVLGFLLGDKAVRA